MNFLHSVWRGVAAGIALAILGGAVFAQERQAPSERQVPTERQAPAERQSPKRFGAAGVIELGGAAAFQYTTPVVDGKTGDGVWSLAASPSGAYFIIDDLSVGAEPLGVAVTHAGSNTYTSLRFFGSVAYHFRVNRLFYPYVQGLAGFTADISSTSAGNSTRSGFSWGGRVGGKFPIADRGLINAGVQYLMIAVNPSGASNRYGMNELAATVGFALWL